jgi:hypothetical protein
MLLTAHVLAPRVCRVRGEPASILGSMERASSLHTVLSGLSVALVAAAIGDPLVESISNTGIFGSGYSDDNHQSVLTVLLAGLVLSALLVAARLRFASGKSGSLRDWLRGATAGFAKTSASRNIAIVFAVQLLVVFAMENCEQSLVHGDPLRGLSWLGAPVLVGLAIHFAVCLCCAFAARRVTSALLAAAIVAICDVLDRLLADRERDAFRAFACRSQRQTVDRPELLAVRRIRGRAPPFATAPA